ncbi:hypothetical protein KSP40_PGU002891 [Platanthera guangdongensis]|uniref:glucose-1-phosphate adenylyltransferase n=1 Tax=Platanthera guangdongensis TaxID=2320717 RepID=A0ABR2LGN5_9ASPA
MPDPVGDIRVRRFPWISGVHLFCVRDDCHPNMHLLLYLVLDNLLGVQAYLFDGYWEDIGTIEAFYNANLGITKKPVPDFSFYDRSAPIYTQPRYLPPSKMLNADVTDSVIGEGCVIKTDADKRFLFAKGSVPIGIGKNSRVKRAIIDKNARIGQNVKVLKLMKLFTTL